MADTPSENTPQHAKNSDVAAHEQPGNPIEMTVREAGDALTEKNVAAEVLGFFRNNALIQCIFIGLLALLLLIPLGFVRDIVYDREVLHREATDNIASTWGKSQTISGPLLVIPYETWRDHKENVVVKKGDKEVVEEVVHREYHLWHKIILPTAVTFSTQLDPEIRYRGIYRQALYNAPVAVQGSFTLPQPAAFASNVHKILWEKAWFAIGVTDLKTIAEAPPLQWGANAMSAYSPGTNAGDILGPGFHTFVPLTEKSAGEKREFSLRLNIRGSGGMYFTPVGENSTITVSGTWADPSFKGNLLPVERQISEKGFSARWNISNLTRTYPQFGDMEGRDFSASSTRDDSLITKFTAGVDLHESVSLYRMAMRAVKYGILFIAVSFVALFAFEMVSRQRMHLLQYGMVGLSMCLFYLVLISLAEHIAFGLAFTAASAVTVSMNSLYVAAAMRSKPRGLLVGILLTALYTLLFALLRMEDYALLVGTGLVVSMMGVLMFVTRRLSTEKPLAAYFTSEK